MDMNPEGPSRLGDEDPDAPTPAHILDLLPGLVAYFGLDLRYRYANERYAEWRSISGREMVGKYVREIVGERNYPLIAGKLREAAAGTPVVYEYDIFDGEQQRRVQGSYVPDVDATGQIIGIIALVTDISVRDDLQRRIARGEAMFNEAFENAPIGNAIVDLEGRLIRSNRAFAAMLGRSQEEMTTLSIVDITHPDDLHADLELLRSVLRKERDGYWLEKRYVRKDGSFLYGKLVVSVVRNDAGDAVRVLAHVEDITQRREAERRLIETNARLSLVTAAIPGGSWHLDIATGRFETSEALAQFVWRWTRKATPPAFTRTISRAWIWRRSCGAKSINRPWTTASRRCPAPDGCAATAGSCATRMASPSRSSASRSTSPRSMSGVRLPKVRRAPIR
jgi:PAS domain S-box-containing protein